MQQAFVSSMPSNPHYAGSSPTTFLGSPVTVQSNNPAHITSNGDIYPEDSYNPVHHEQSMWRAVIVQALMDASSSSQKSEALTWKREAEIWLRGNSPDFHTVCFYADLDPDFVREVAAKSLQKGCVWRAAPGTGPMKKDPRRTATRSPRHFTQRR